MDNKIKEGAFQIARQLFNSQLWLEKPSSWKIIWIYILGKVNHDNNKHFNRGEGFFNFTQELKQIGRDISYDQIRHSMTYFKKSGMLSTIKSTRGIIIKVLKYNKFQTLDNYRSTTESTMKAQSKHNESTTINKNVKNAKKVKKVYSPTSNEVRLSNLLLDLILNKKDNFKKPDIQKWSLHIDRILHIDKRTPEEIEKVIRWCQYDDFWCVNILSTEKLRKQIDKLEIRMNNKPNKQGAGYGQIKRHSEGYPEGTPFEECKK